MAKGWIRIFRQIQDCDLWVDKEPFDRRSAWIDLLLSCNHENKGLIFDGHRMVVERGQFLTSVRRLSERWHWSKDRTLRFLRLLEELQMIERESNARRTLISIVNYEVFQGMPDSNEDTHKDTHKDSSKDTHKDTHAPQTSNEKNEKNEKNINIDSHINIYSSSFNEFWEHYPRKQDKGQAYKQYKARLNDGYSEEQLLTACMNYAAECEKEKREKKYIKVGSTFLSVNEPFIDYLNENMKGEGIGTDARLTSEEIARRNAKQREAEIDAYLASDEFKQGFVSPFADM